MNARKMVGLVAGVLVTAGGAQADVFNMGTGLTSMDFVTVGNPGNAPDTRYSSPGYGSVSYTYLMGKFEVTAGQYCEFLNKVAATDTYGLYSPSMWSDSQGCKIKRSGSLGSYTYSVASDYANRPVNYVSWGDAARFANWVTNGQASGGQSLGTTEDGSYFLNGANSDSALMAVTRKANARNVVPSEDESYKAAYYKGGGTNAGYWNYPTRSNTVPVSEAPPGHSEPPGSGNYKSDGGTLALGSPYYRTEVGAYSVSPSPYGTFDQGGNVFEWEQTSLNAGTRRNFSRGGSYANDKDGWAASYRATGMRPTYEDYAVGFRVSNVGSAPPQPKTHVLCVGVRDPNSNHGGDVNAKRVLDAFSQIGSVQRGVTSLLALNTRNEGNRAALEAAINGMRINPQVNPGDTFVFYINCHGYYTLEANEAPVNAQYDANHLDLRIWNTGDEKFFLRHNSDDNISDDDFSALFLDPKWEQINKLFILDTCFAGGFVGTTQYGDTGDLARLQRVALLAASSEGNFSFSHKDPLTGFEVGNLGTALVQALTNLKDSNSITFDDLYAEVDLVGSSLFENTTGRIQDFEDNWGIDVPVAFDLERSNSAEFGLTLGVPEPATLSLLALGGLGVMRRRRSG